MAKYLLNKQGLMAEGREIVLELIGELMNCDRKTPEQWLAEYTRDSFKYGMTYYKEHIEMVALDLVAVGEEIDGAEDKEGMLYNLVYSVLVNESLKVAREEGLQVA